MSVYFERYLQDKNVHQFNAVFMLFILISAVLKGISSFRVLNLNLNDCSFLKTFVNSVECPLGWVENHFFWKSQTASDLCMQNSDKKIVSKF